MSTNRDFKGVWIPKEIWLNNELTLLEKCIYTEIDSLDNEDHCTAGNEYFAEFCNCSESKVTKAIKKLQELGLIEVLSFDGRRRVVKITKQSRKKYEAESYKVRTNNINNKTNNNTELFISKDINNNFEFGKKREPKQSLYHKCVTHIIEFTKNDNNSDIQHLLFTFLDSLVEMKKLRGETQFVGILNKLKEYGKTEDDKIKIIKHSIEHGYGTFYELNEFKKKSNNYASSDMGRVGKRMTAEQKKQFKEDIASGKAEKY